MEYPQALTYLYSLEQFGIKFGLQNIQRIMALLGNPERTLRGVHIAGTNGKGSVAAYISSILQSCGYKVGLYTSPHLVKFEERIAINSNPISADELTQLVEKIQPIVNTVAKEPDCGQPTFFEVTTAIALVHFAQNKVDFVVLEVGMGGRLDATNVVDAKVAIITNVTFDHMQYLGNTLTQVAFEKAGIIKQNAIVITAAEGEALTELKRICTERDNISFGIPTDIRYQEKGVRKGKGRIDRMQEFEVITPNRKYQNLRIQMRGKHQLINATLAVAGVEAMQSAYQMKCDIFKSVAEGLARTKWPGRLEIVRQDPMVILDGAHNVAGVGTLRAALLEEFTYEKLYLIIGIANDKESQKMLNLLCPLAEEVILTAAKTHRAIQPETLFEQAKPVSKQVTIVKTVSDAIQYALQKAAKNDLICIAGSLYVVGEARKHLVK